MKALKVFAIVLILGLAGLVYAANAAQSSTKACKMDQTGAACCKAEASCCAAGAACCVPGADCCKEDGSCKTQTASTTGSSCCVSDCCKEGASCCASGDKADKAVAKAASGHSCCSTTSDKN